MQLGSLGYSVVSCSSSGSARYFKELLIAGGEEGTVWLSLKAPHSCSGDVTTGNWREMGGWRPCWHLCGVWTRTLTVRYLRTVCFQSQSGVRQAGYHPFSQTLFVVNMCAELSHRGRRGQDSRDRQKERRGQAFPCLQFLWAPMSQRCQPKPFLSACDSSAGYPHFRLAQPRGPQATLPHLASNAGLETIT